MKRKGGKTNSTSQITTEPNLRFENYLKHNKIFGTKIWRSNIAAQASQTFTDPYALFQIVGCRY